MSYSRALPQAPFIFLIFIIFYLFILAALGLHCGMRAFSICSSRLSSFPVTPRILVSRPAIQTVLPALKDDFWTTEEVSCPRLLKFSPWQSRPVPPIHSVQLSHSVVSNSLTLCNPTNRSTPGLPVHHQLLESTQTHVH